MTLLILTFSSVCTFLSPKIDKKSECLDILRLFGISGGDSDEKGLVGPTRLVVGDAFLEEAWKKTIRGQNLSFTEIKSENSIDRIKGTASNPRFTERVVEGARFSLSLRLKIFENEDLKPLLFKALKLLELDALGGSGSRGYGRVQIEFNDPEGAIQERYDKANPFS